MNSKIRKGTKCSKEGVGAGTTATVPLGAESGGGGELKEVASGASESKWIMDQWIIDSMAR
jgi:hypothetical protein